MSTIKIVEIMGTSKKDWEDAAKNAVSEASETINGITGIEVVGQTAKIEKGEISEFRTTVKVAFKVKSRR